MAPTLESALECGRLQQAVNGGQSAEFLSHEAIVSRLSWLLAKSHKKSSHKKARTSTKMKTRKG